MFELGWSNDKDFYRFYITLTLSLPESIMETCNVVLTFESVNEIPWCDHSNKISFTVLSHGTICSAGFEKLKIVMMFLKFLLWPLLGVKGLKY